MINTAKSSPSDLTERLTELQIQLGNILLVDPVTHALPALPLPQRRVCDQQTGRKELLQRIEDCGGWHIERRRDLSTSLVGVRSEVPDYSGPQSVAERLDGILRTIIVRGAGVSGHAPIVLETPTPRPADRMKKSFTLASVAMYHALMSSVFGATATQRNWRALSRDVPQSTYRHLDKVETNLRPDLAFPPPSRDEEPLSLEPPHVSGNRCGRPATALTIPARKRGAEAGLTRAPGAPFERGGLR